MKQNILIFLCAAHYSTVSNNHQ